MGELLYRRGTFHYEKLTWVLPTTLLLFLCQLSLAFPVYGPPQLHARLRIVFASPKTLICSKEATGQPSEIFALDPVEKKVLWRHSGTSCATPATLLQTSRIVYVDKTNHLVCRELRTGKAAWQTDLSAIRPLDSAWDMYGPIRKEADWLSLEFWYERPHLQGNGVAIFREELPSGGFGGPSFYDWLFFHVESGKLLKKGAGRLLGRAGKYFLVKRFPIDPSTHVNSSEKSSVPKHETLEILGDIMAGERWQYPPYTPHDYTWNPINLCMLDRVNGFDFPGQDIQFIRANHCLISGDFLNERMAIFDAATRKLDLFNASPRKHVIDNWLLLRDYIVRYVERRNMSKDPPWIKVFDTAGKPIGRKSFPKSFGAVAMEYVTCPEDDQVVFLVFTVRQDQLVDILLTLEIPSLKTISAIQLPKACRKSFPTHNDKVMYEVLESDFYIDESEVEGETYPHQMSIGIVDCRTGKTLFRHTETVLLRKSQASPAQ